MVNVESLCVYFEGMNNIYSWELEAKRVRQELERKDGSLA